MFTPFAIAKNLKQEVGSAITLRTDNGRAMTVLPLSPYLNLYDGRVQNLHAFGYKIERVKDNNNAIQLHFYSHTTGKLVDIKTFPTSI